MGSICGVDAVAHRAGDGNPVITVLCGVPVPVVFGGIEFFARTGGEIGLQRYLVAPEWMDAGLPFNQPVFGRADAGSTGRFAFKQERCAITELCEGRVDSEVPDGRRDEVV